MKYIILTALIFCSVQAICQQKDIFKRNPMQELQRKQDLNKLLSRMQANTTADTLALGYRKIENHDWVVGERLKGAYTGNNGKGSDIYKVKSYRMPCLVPDKTFKSNMPIAGAEKMTNDFTTPYKQLEDSEAKR